MNHPEIAAHIQHQADITALDYLYDVWVIRDTKEPRCFALEFVSLVSRSVGMRVDA
jgi:template-activating factor I